MLVGILALQGAFAEHAAMLQRLNVDSFEIRRPRDALRYMDGLILPGGESTVMGKLLHELKLFEPLRRLIGEDLPTFGTCAGLLLLAKSIANDEARYFGTMDIIAQRNAYGRQLGSFFVKGSFGKLPNVPMTFIRAPYILEAGPATEVLATHNGLITAARQSRQLACAFHPELGDDTRILAYFLDMIKNG